MKLKALVGGVLLVAASVSASAANYDLGTLDGTSFDTSSLTSSKYAAGFNFTDSWKFTITTTSATSFGAQQTFAVAIGEISGFGAELNGNPFTLTQDVPNGQQNLSWTGNLAPGVYTVNVWGHANLKNTQYTATVSALPVPEPETYGMLLGGLGVLGLAARRRAKKSA